MTSTFPISFPPGSRIHNRYRVLSALGSGVNGEVYLVLDERQDIEVALKMLNPRKPPPAGQWIEAEKLTELRGDYILPILNADDEAGVPFIVTEVMRNGSTAERMPPGVGAPVDLAATWIQQACVGVARIHDRRLLHNDIKPANLFLDSDDNVLVGDFGLVCEMDSQGIGHPAGSPETMAPEIPTTQATSVSTDVYSLGASLYELIAGHWLNPAITKLDDPSVYAIIAGHTPAPIGEVAPHVPRSLRGVIMKAVDPNPSRRYATSTDLAAAIGGRQRPDRTWIRRPPCPGHTTCFAGTRPGGAEIRVCVSPVGPGRHVVQSLYEQSGRRAQQDVPVASNQIPKALRRLFDALSR